MKLSVYGLGYVGCVLAICLKKMGHDVIGVDIVKEKVDLINSGKLPFYEPNLEEMNNSESTGSFSATTDSLEAGIDSELSFICVGTPSTASAGADLNQVSSTIRDIGKAIKNKKSKHLLVVRSTIPPGTVEELIMPILIDENGLKETTDFSVAFYPEFLREGTAVADLLEPSLNIIGTMEGFPVDVMEAIFSEVEKPFMVTDIKTAEMLKYSCNAFHGLKVAFANEIGALSKSLKINGEEVMNLLTKDTLLNLSPYYLRPGFAYGGSCIPKELRAIENIAKENGLDLELLKAISESNDSHIDRLVSLIESLKSEKIGFLGITFKPDTDDIRDSPILKAIHKLLHVSTGYKKSVKPLLFDNKEALENTKKEFLPEIHTAESVTELINESEVVVLGPLRLEQSEYEKLDNSGKIIIDLKWHKVPEKLTKSSKYMAIV